jgi:hypothetical protein
MRNIRRELTDHFDFDIEFEDMNFEGVARFELLIEDDVHDNGYTPIENVLEKTVEIESVTYLYFGEEIGKMKAENMYMKARQERINEVMPDTLQKYINQYLINNY